MAMALFTSRPNSHPFEERRVPLTEPVKIGRSVAKSRPATNNCIFDCKVLSRNHAIFWYEDGKFYLRDTKSSNGTFVNNVRLSKGSEESEPKELKSGDIVQFGVDVVENSKKVTHGCIVATVTLFLPDGKEATKGGVPRSLFALNENGIQAQEMWQLSQYLQDALYREQMLENKLVNLQRLISDSHALLEDNSQAFAQEDKLLSRLETLENHLETLTRNLNEDDIKKELLALQEDRHSYEMRAKESLKKVLQEKLEAIQRLTEIEKSCSTAEDECFHFKSLYERSQQELQDLAEKHKQRLQEMQQLQEQVEEAERRHSTVEEQALHDRAEFETKLKEAQSRENALAAKAESLQAKCDFKTEQVTAMKTHMEKAKDELVHPVNTNDHTEGMAHLQEDSVDEPEKGLNGTRELKAIPVTFEDGAEENKNPKEIDYSNTDDVKILHVQVERLHGEVGDKERILESLLAQLEVTRLQHSENVKEIQLLKDQINKSKAATLDDKERIESLEEQVMKYHLQAIDDFSMSEDDDVVGVDHLDSSQQVSNSLQLVNKSDAKYSPEESDLVQQLHDRIHEVKRMAEERHLMMISWLDEDDEENGAEVNERTTLHLEEGRILQTRNTRELLQDSLLNVQDIKGDFIEIGRIIDNEHEECQHVQGQLNDTQQELKENNELVVELQEELKNAQTYTKDFKQQILDLRDKLLEEQDSTRKKDEVVAQIKRELNELVRERDLLLLERKCEHHATETAINNAREMQKQAAKSAKDAGKNKAELSATIDDNRFLKQRIQTLESELKKYRRENNRLTSDQSRLQATYREIENQSKLLSEKILRQQHSMKEKIERQISKKKLTEDQASALEERLQEAEAKHKEAQEAAERKLQQLNETNSQLWHYLMAGFVLFIGVILAYAFGFVELAPGWRTHGFWS